MEILYFLLFFILSIISVFINIIFYTYKKKEYSLVKSKKIVYVFLIISSVFLILGLPFFITNSPRVIINSFDSYLIPIILYNFAVFFFSISLIFFCLPYLEIDENIINLDIPSYPNSKKGTVNIGRCLKGKKRKHNFFLSIKDLEKHMFICGATGTGKSNFLQNFLIHFTNYHKIPFLLVEFKGEHHVLQKMIKDVLILWPGENFSINIFNPEKSNPKIHAERIFDILKSGRFLDETEFSPQMEKVLVEIMTKMCQNKELQNWKGFEYYCNIYLKNKQKEIPMLRQTLISIKNRIRRFSSGPLRVLFEQSSEIDMNNLFKRNIILDLSSIIRLGGEKEDALFFVNMVLKYLWDQNLTKGAYNFKGIKHVSIIEDAQYFAPHGLMEKTKLTSYLEDIALLQRGTGECLITLATRPSISKEILANLGIVVTFKNHIEKDFMCELLNLDIESKNYLSILDVGQCLIRINSIKEPFLLWVPYINRHSLRTSDIIEANERILDYDKFPSSIRMESKKARFLEKLKSRISQTHFKKKLSNNWSQTAKNNCIINKNRNNQQIDQEEFTSKKSFVFKDENYENMNTTPILKNKHLAKFQNNQYGIINLNTILKRYAKIKELYQINRFNDLFYESKKIIDEILEKISLQLGFNYKNIEHFLNVLNNLGLEENFILYEEFFEFKKNIYNSYKNIDSISPSIANLIVMNIEKIIEKLKCNSLKKKKVSSDVCNLLNTKSLRKNKQTQLNISDQQNERDIKRNSFLKVKSFIKELYELEIKKK